jgi:CheY-like chemotaxis protein
MFWHSRRKTRPIGSGQQLHNKGPLVLRNISFQCSPESTFPRKSLLTESPLSLAEQVLYHLQQTSSATKNRGGIVAMTLAEQRGTGVLSIPRRNAATSACLSRDARDELFSTSSDAHSKTILLVDDEPCLLEVRRLIFEALGYFVRTTNSGEEALEVLQLEVVDAVILDYLLPGMDGEEAARRIRKRHPNIPIILSSGGFSAPDRVLKSANAFVNKGEGPEALIEVLEEQLQLVPDVRPHPAEPARFSQSAD